MNRTNDPLVSVIVPSYNHEKFIEKCIISIFSQSYKNFELIVVDDGSTDSSRSILQALRERYGFTLLFQANMGLPKTLNNAIRQLAKGKYVSVCASDDYWLSKKLEKQVAFMEQNPDIPMCFGKVLMVDEDDNILKKLTGERNQNLKGGLVFEDILLMNFHPPVTYLHRKWIFEEVGYFREDIVTEDFYMNLQISHRYPIGYIDEFLGCYRTTRDYSRKLISNKSAISHLACIQEFKSSECYPEAIRRWNYRTFVWYSSYTRHKAFAFLAMTRSLRYFFKIGYVKALIKLMLLWR
jgi:alpha-1,3-rhamnosyltransferase